ncbi:MAG: TetR/AcrR family transcriptional regulator [Desulfobacteraceae bacterium]|nr:TetR/AcrR family transcriptional regulator [Desulfobacteraceae bacterium]MBC2755455.1 TetR/AcrR family transcriptional regulator [Desulfobacteraceae bacterium]
MSPKLVDKTEKINEIATAALYLFAKKGYAATSVEQIAEAAGIGKGTVYEYFPSKEEIFVHAINDWIMDLINRMLEKTRDIENPVERLKAFIEMVKDVLNVEEPDPKKLFADIDQQTFMQGGAFYKRRHIIKDMRATFCDLVVDILLDGVSKKVFKPEIARDVSKIAINLLAYLDGICMHYLIMEEYQEFEDQIDFHVKGFVDYILV